MSEMTDDEGIKLKGKFAGNRHLFLSVQIKRQFVSPIGDQEKKRETTEADTKKPTPQGTFVPQQLGQLCKKTVHRWATGSQSDEKSFHGQWSYSDESLKRRPGESAFSTQSCGRNDLLT
ncbi:hypothetical protein [Desulfobulbus propionicus]|jgi:hypothetical protein